jgi:hypothetical protein
MTTARAPSASALKSRQDLERIDVLDAGKPTKVMISPQGNVIASLIGWM